MSLTVRTKIMRWLGVFNAGHVIPLPGRPREMLSAVPQEALEEEVEAMLAEGILCIRPDGRVALSSRPDPLPETQPRMVRRDTHDRMGV